MSLQTISGWCLVAAFVLVVVASVIGPNEVYSAPDSETRLAVIEANQGRWTATNIVWALSGLVAAVGLILLSIHLSASQPSWLPYLAAAVFGIASLAWATFLIQRMINPAGHLYTTPPSLSSIVFLWAALAGLTLYGVTFLQGPFPNWPGYLLIGAMVLLLIGVVVNFDALYASFPPQAFWLLTLIVGIVALRQ